MNTKVEYLYRDGSNYKVWNTVVVKGTLTDEKKQEIFDSCDDIGYFIPRQVGLPEKRFEDTTDDDHCWFELKSIEDTKEPPTVDRTAGELHEKFLFAAGNWDETFI